MEVHLTILSEQAQKLIAEQRRRYIDSMPDKRRAIRQCMLQFNAALQNSEPDLCDKLFQQIHRLAGSAGSYGFESLGLAASVVDRYLTANSLQVANLPELTSLLQNLLNEIDDVIRNND
ncbi:MAG: Hpt domain-containing protein [Lysobacterales bacterium]